MRHAQEKECDDFSLFLTRKVIGDVCLSGGRLNDGLVNSRFNVIQRTKEGVRLLASLTHECAHSPRLHPFHLSSSTSPVSIGARLRPNMIFSFDNPTDLRLRTVEAFGDLSL